MKVLPDYLYEEEQETDKESQPICHNKGKERATHF
jgi:hypothetical protein